MSTSKAPWGLLILLAVSVLVNYMDRGNLSVAAPVLTVDIGLTPVHMGVLLSAFFWTYAAFQLVGGWLVDRYDVAKVYSWGYLLWSLATLAIGLVDGFVALLALRLVLGIGESVAYPAYSKLLTVWFKEEQRGLANAIIDAATKFGPAIGTLVGGWMIAAYGWRAFFVVTGAVTLLWLIPWIRMVPPSPGRIEGAPEGPGWMAILKKRAAWATFIGLFCHNYNWYLLLTWLPTYLVKERHFSMQAMAVYNALPLVATAIATMTAGALSDRLIARGAKASNVRRNFLITGMLIAACCLPVSTTPLHLLSMTLLTCAFVGIGIYTSNCWALTQYLAGQTAAGSWTGIQNAIGNLGGVVAPVVTGYLVQRTGHFWPAFITSSAVLTTGALTYFLMLREDGPAKWETGRG